MQKFVRMKSTASIPEEQAALHPSQVKLVGYLKKKRTKVGGWRKMWFVLQNQLLLSYSSKEDYDKKLVSFKDVLNLVPGTIVRPLGGYRFAIQTTSESVYIFRCDDNKTYMEWITALVESLSINSSGGKKKDGFGGIIPKKPLHASHSCSSLIRSKKNKASVHMPIAHGTARILNRTGLSENDLRAFSSNECSQHDATQRANYFCLHENQFQLQNQSNAVSRINRMFCGSVSDVEVSSTINPTTSDMGLVQQATTIPTMTTTMTTTTTSTMAMTTPMTTGVKSSGITGLESESDGDVIRKSVLNNKMHQLLSYMKTDNLNKVQLMPECEFPRDINSNRSFNYENLLGLESAYFGETLKLKPADIVDGNATIEDRIQRLSLRGSSGFVVNESRNILTDQEANFLRLSTTIRTQEGSPFLRQRRRNEQGCASVSSAGSCSSSAKKNETSCNGDETEMSEQVGRNFQNEPIYAVVDLKNKYEHRARIRHEMEERRKSHGGYMKSLDEVSTDYEEVLNFQEESSNDYKETGSSGYEEENIYEPINIPESSYGNDKHRNGLWKYISRINIDALIEMARNRKKNSKSSEHTSPFANIRQKIGHHRKSIRIRMNKFYTREQPTEEIRENTEASDKELDQI